MKKLICVFLSIIMCIPLCVSVFAEENNCNSSQNEYQSTGVILRLPSEIVKKESFSHYIISVFGNVTAVVNTTVTGSYNQVERTSSITHIDVSITQFNAGPYSSNITYSNGNGIVNVYEGGIRALTITYTLTYNGSMTYSTS